MVFIILISGVVSDAQSLQFLNANNVNAGIGVGGNLFSKLDSFVDFSNLLNNRVLLYEVPKGSNKRAILTSSLWLTALDSGGNLHGAAQTYAGGGHDFFDGPVASVYDSVYDSYYKRVFKITQNQVSHHRSMAFPVLASQVDSAILIWPGKGNSYVSSEYGVNIISKLAPFVDLNNNGIYEPLSGEYPALCGDEAIFFCLNDFRGLSGSGCQRLGVEIHGLAYSLNDSTRSNLPTEKRALNNTVFVEYEIENKSNANYSDFYMALFEDPDLGCYQNDRVGCDTVRNMMFVYNATTPDPNCWVESGILETGYGFTMVSEGAIILNQKMSSSAYFTTGTGPDIFDCALVRNQSTGYWPDGTPFTEGGTGYGGTKAVKYVFPSDPNDSSGWSEETESSVIATGDRRITGSVGPMSFAASAIIHLDLAFTTSYDTTTASNMIRIVDTLKRDADIVQAFYNNNILSCRSQLIAAEIKDVRNDVLSVSVFPNPANGQLTVQSTENIQLFEMRDMEGRVVLQKAPAEKNATISTAIFARGVYLLIVKSEGNSVVKKVVLE